MIRNIYEELFNIYFHNDIDSDYFLRIFPSLRSMLDAQQSAQSFVAAPKVY